MPGRIWSAARRPRLHSGTLEVIRHSDRVRMTALDETDALICPDGKTQECPDGYNLNVDTNIGDGRLIPLLWDGRPAGGGSG